MKYSQPGPHKTPRSVSRHDQLRKKLRESKSVTVTADRRHNYRLASPQPGFASVLVSALFSPTVSGPGPCSTRVTRVSVHVAAVVRVLGNPARRVHTCSFAVIKLTIVSS